MEILASTHMWPLKMVLQWVFTPSFMPKAKTITVARDGLKREIEAYQKCCRMFLWSLKWLIFRLRAMPGFIMRSSPWKTFISHSFQVCSLLGTPCFDAFLGGGWSRSRRFSFWFRGVTTAGAHRCSLLFLKCLLLFTEPFFPLLQGKQIKSNQIHSLPLWY